MKKEYEALYLNVIEVQSEDIMTASNGLDNTADDNFIISK